MSGSRINWKNRVLRFKDRTTGELLDVAAARKLIDDFDYTAINTNVWTDLDLNSATTTAPATSIFKMEIGQVNENAAAGLYGRDDKLWNIDKGLIFEVCLAIHTAPTLTTEIGFGVMNDSYGADSMRFLLADEIAKYAFMGFYTTVGAGLRLCIRTDDNTAFSGIVDTGETVALDVYHVYAIDFTDPSNVYFYLDGNRLAAETTFKMNTAADLMVQPWICVYKHDDATTLAAGEVYLDYIKMFQPAR